MVLQIEIILIVMVVAYALAKWKLSVEWSMLSAARDRSTSPSPGGGVFHLFGCCLDFCYSDHIYGYSQRIWWCELYSQKYNKKLL